ncbi:esterase/lipase family protein [Alkaliphilus pronyensis]|uniref:esterase/lipase family protein n=1 Tax=Alkaliphilus pronyensis TaxID=1482732 RepID=UPI0018656FBF|nr:hypothetical protein [Alkaliphilus pronyensis]
MKELVKNPIVFIPGLMGSIGEEMIRGTGKWKFGVASWIYQPFIKGLEELGYRKEENLFICHYDWRKTAKDVEKEYLRPLLQTVREKHPTKSIDIMAHSYGGIVTRCYIQGDNYNYDVDRVLLMGTPNCGTVEAYYLWSTGKLLEGEKKSINDYLYKGYLWVLAKLLKISLGSGDVEAIHNQLPSIGNLIPSNEYGDFLCYETVNRKINDISRHLIRYDNFLLDRLNYNQKIIQSRIKQGYSIIGTGFSTHEKLILKGEELIKNNEEYIMGTIKTLQGDGTVILKSAELNSLNNIVLKKNHQGLLKGALKEIGEIYGEALEDSYEEFKTLHIIISGDINLTIEAAGGFKLLDLRNGNVFSRHQFIQQVHHESLTWIIMKDTPMGEYDVITNSLKQEKFNILIMGDGISRDIDEEVQLNDLQVNEKQVFKLQVIYEE